MSLPHKRIRKPTLKGMAAFEEKVKNFEKRLSDKYEDISSILKKDVSADVSVTTLNNLDESIKTCHDDYLYLAKTYTDYLIAANTVESLQINEHFQAKLVQIETEVVDFVTTVGNTKQEILEQLINGSHVSPGNGSIKGSIKGSQVLSRRSVNNGSHAAFAPSRKPSTKGSHVSSGKSSKALEMLTVKYAEAQAAKTKAQYAEEEATLVKEKARLEQQTKIAKAENDRKLRELESDMNVLSFKKAAAAAQAEVDAIEKISNIDSASVASKSLQNLPVTKPEDKVKHFLSHDHVTHETTNEQMVPVTENLTNYILKKELVLSRITNFNDAAETYQSWKSSFKQVTSELKINPPEEIDLLIKWLGPDSKKHALSLKSVYIKNPKMGLQKIWERLDERYGSPETVHKIIMKKLEKCPKLTHSDNTKWYELSDIVAEIQALKEDEEYSTPLAYFDSAVGISPILAKLPLNVQERWASRANNYKETHGVHFPPFSLFTTFIHEQAKIKNDPSLSSSDRQKFSAISDSRKPVISRKTDIATEQKPFAQEFCPLHRKNHSLNKCRVFKSKSINERKQFLKSNGVCFKCCDSNRHRASECRATVKCVDCGSSNHPGAMHFGNPNSQHFGSRSPQQQNGGEREDTNDTVDNKCTQICGDNPPGKSCAKFVLVNIYSSVNPSNVVKCYAMLDEQSNRSLIKPELFTLLNINGQEFEYTLNSCAGTHVTHGRRASDCVIQSVDGLVSYNLPTLIECSDIPSSREEICSPRDASYHSHLTPIVKYIPEIDDNADILLLIGRDLVDAHQVYEQVLGPPGTPFAQKLGLGWVVIGEVCIGKVHAQDKVNVNKTQILSNGRPSLFQPCSNRFVLNEKASRLYDPVFVQDVNDDQPSFSVEDREFMGIMDDGLKKAPSGKWTAPLPFKSPRQRLPNNKSEALRRAKWFHTSLEKNPEKRKHMTEFMGKILSNGHAEIAPDLVDGEECWFLPVFGVYNSKKPGQIRGVFDSSAAYQGVSLNSVLLTGPDLTNSLVGVLMRFRSELVAVAADIEQMFYCFEVDETHRNYLRFFWYQDNDIGKPLIEYRMCRHVFGNSPSPAIASYGLRKSVENSDTDVKDFVHNNFYVDDGLTSRPSVDEAVDLLKRTQIALQRHSLHLHKIVSNNVEVMKCFSADDLAKGLRSLNFEKGLPMQRSLGLEWDLNSDSFVFMVESSDKTPSRRSVLSTVNSVFDPLGFLAPFTVVGKLILRDIVAEHCNWDEPISPNIEAKWLVWKYSLHLLSSLHIPRSYFPVSLRDITNLELHVFCDASELAISAVAYLVGHTNKSVSHVGFVMGKSKVAPSKGHTIPRLELCGAVLAVEVAQTIFDQLRLELGLVKYYTDSRIVLGYIHNQTRRFYTYVSNRVQKIRRVSEPKQWNYISSKVNPADVGSRGVSPAELKDSSWLSGPAFLRNQPESFPEFFPIVGPDQDKEIRCNVSVNVASIEVSNQLGTSRFERFSSWSKLVASVSTLRHVASSFCRQSQCQGWHRCPLSKSPDFQCETECLIIKIIQGEVYKNEISCLKGHRNIDRDSTILGLDPYLDEHCTLRVGGRLSRSDLMFGQKHPLIIPGKHYVAKLLVNHFHALVQHQGRQLTEGAIRDAGFWITGGRRLVSSQIYNCVPCKKLRGRFLEQKMSDLPADRVKQAAPFSYVGVDVFGPWSVVCRRTRGGQASSKRWAVLFTCLTIRAIHIEVVDEMSSSAFINALRRFISVRGKVKQFRSDRGTNFIGATDPLNIDAVNVEDEKTQTFLHTQRCVWVFNAPHSSHMGGSWERMIGIARRILESMLSSIKTLTHDVLVTLMAEVSAIVNARPIVPVSSDPDMPQVLSPSTLLTSKIECDLNSYGNLDIKALYREQWKRVQYLAEQFWHRWKREYLNSLQKRPKWKYEQVSLDVGDIVLLKDRESSRNCWPMGRVSKVFPSVDNKVRKVEVQVFKDGKLTSFTRPIVELILLVKTEH